MSNALRIKGDAELIARLEAMSNTVARKAVRAAIGAGATIMLKGIRSQITDDKALRKSIGRRNRTYKNSGVVTTIIGPRFDFEQDGVKPSKYAAAVEYGTEFTRPNPFMRRGYSQFVQPALAAMRQRLADRIESEAAK